MQTGKQDRIIRFLSNQGVSDGYGGTTVNLVEILKTFAEVHQVKAKEDLEQLQSVMNKTYRFIVKYRQGFTPDLSMTVFYNNNSMTIKGIELNNERHKRFWTITCIDNGTD